MIDIATLISESAVIGMEDYKLPHDSTMEEEKMDGIAIAMKAPQLSVHIRTSDNIHFRTYFASELLFNPPVVNQFCCFLDSLTPQQELTLVLGSRVDDTQSHVVGAIADAIQRCKGTVIGVAAGYCSICETILWTFCQKHAVLRYGALTFGVTDFIKQCKAYEAYFQAFLRRSYQIGAISQQEYDEIWKTKSGIFLMYHDFVNRKSAGITSQSATTDTDTTDTDI